MKSVHALHISEIRQEKKLKRPGTLASFAQLLWHTPACPESLLCYVCLVIQYHAKERAAMVKECARMRDTMPAQIQNDP